jgi:tetratricopeptide (TPR) repeat protein
MDHLEQTSKLAFEAYNAARYVDAEALCQTLLQIKPDDAQILFLYGMIHHKTGRDLEAMGKLHRAAELLPTTGRIFSGMGCACRGLGNEAGAAEHFTRATELEPQNANHYYNLGIAWHNLGELDHAMAAFQQAVALNPRDEASWNNIGKIFKQFNRLEDSLAAYNRALEISPGFELARYGRAIMLLANGHLTEGFREYESRYSKVKPRQFAQPRWHGEPVVGKTVFIHAEQGFGDAIHFVRFVAEARARAGRVILECRPELKSLFIYSGVADEVIAFGEPIPPFDVFTSIISLPGALGVTRENFPRQVPYLQAPPANDLPAAMGGIKKVGIAWAGNPSHSDDASRSMSLEMFAPIVQVPTVSFYSLQMPVPERDQVALSSLPNVVDLSPRLKDFLATAALIQQLDLVIAVDTSVAHLAGALAIPVWTLLQFDADWRWFLDQSETAWYPTMRLFRQQQRKQWSTVIQQVLENLRQLP